MDEEHSLQAGQQQEKHICKRRFFKQPSPQTLLRGGIIALSVLATVIFTVCGVWRMKKAYETALQDTYSDFYQTAYDYAETANHVSNYVRISIEDTREISLLEVLTVSDSEFIIKNADRNDPTTSWLEVQGTGVFTVDLSACEFIADSERQYVLVRVPKPTLTECKVSGTGKQFWKRNSIFNGSVADGVRLSQNQLSEGRIKLEDSIKQNRGFYEAAKSAAVDMIGSLVKKWNPNISDLQIDVEFFENN